MHDATRKIKTLVEEAIELMWIISNQITIYESISIPINHIRYDLQVYRQVTLTHKRLISS